MKAEHTDAASAAKLAGVCVVLVVVDAHGSVIEASVAESLSPDLDARAIEAAKRWKFRPARKDGVPVTASLKIEFAFQT